jgi:hypothetical protein
MPTLASQLIRIADAAVIATDTRVIAESLELPADVRAQVVDDAMRLCSDITSLAEAMGEDEDEPELYRSLAALWLELRFEWQRHNLVANYDTMRTGTCAPLVMVRASVASYVLDRIEALLAQEHRDRLGDSAVDMLDALRTDVEHARVTSAE